MFRTLCSPRWISLGFRGQRFRSSRRLVAPPSTIAEKHIRTETIPVNLDDLSPVVRQILSKDPSYALRFGGRLSSNEKYLVREHSRTTGRAENLFSQIPEEDLVPSIDTDEKDLPRPPIVAFPSADNQFQADLGTEDRSIASKKQVRCFGCGATLQCADRTQPGFMPVEIYKHHLFSHLQKQSSQCQRCFLFKFTREISHCEVNERVYEEILVEIQRKRALIVLLVDLLDLPNSISRSWANLGEPTGRKSHSASNLIFVLGNKVDLLPKDSEASLSNVRHSLEVECEKRGLGKHLVQYYGLISARTGFGVEEFISKVYRYWSQHGGVYLLGGTNAGKTSLFNTLLDSDLCHIHALDCIQRATVSNLPGTTMNVLRFPIQLRTGKNQFLRAERLKDRELDEPVESTVKWRRRFESEVNLPKSGVSYNYSSGENSFHEDRSFQSKEDNYIHFRQKKMRAFQAQSYQREKWLYDTPGVTLAEQMINRCTSQEELAFFDHQTRVIQPMNISLTSGETILVGGIVRIDVKQISNNARASLSLMTTSRLPVNVVPTGDVDEFYARALAKNELGVPQNRIHGRLQDPSELRGPTIEILGLGEEEAAGDVVFSSAGWASVQCTRHEYVLLDVKTPDGLGIHLRQPSLLRDLFRLRGAPIEGTPFFEKVSSVEKEEEEEEEEKNEHFNEMQMIINEKLWRGEENKPNQLANVKLKPSKDKTKDFSDPKLAGFLTANEITSYQKNAVQANIEEWQIFLHEETFPTYYFPLSSIDAEHFVRIFERHFQSLHNEQKFEEISRRMSSTLDDDPEEQRWLAEINARLQKTIDAHFSKSEGFFAKTSSRSAKDASLFRKEFLSTYREQLSNCSTPEEENSRLFALLTAAFLCLRVHCAEDVLSMFISSERIYQDMLLALDVSRQSPSTPFFEHLVLRPFVSIAVDMEFRGFVFEERLTCLSQYNYLIYSPRLIEGREKILEKISQFFNETVKKKLQAYPAKSYVIDFALTEGDALKVWVIELNPFLETTDGGLFSWQHERDLLEGRSLSSAVIFRLTERARPGSWSMLPLSVRQWIPNQKS